MRLALDGQQIELSEGGSNRPIFVMTDGGSTRDSERTTTTHGVAFLFGQIFLVPFRTLLYGMERLLEVMRNMQRVGDGGMRLMVGSETAEPSPSPAPKPVSQPGHSDSIAAPGGIETVIEENKHMDKDLNDDMLKLVRYKILFVKRDHEHAFPEQEELVSDNMDGSAFTAWKVAEFIQSLGKKKTRVPEKWDKYPDKKDDHGKHLYREGDTLTGLPEDDKKYLRVFFEVMDRYPREKLKYEEDQLHVLREIKEAIRDKKSGDGKGVNVG